MTPTIDDVIDILSTHDLGLDTILDWQDLTIRELRDYKRDHGDNLWYVDYYKAHHNFFYRETIQRALEKLNHG